MNLKRKLGLDILSEKYAYGEDPQYGYTSAQKIPDHWVSTTCGYCSVGCGMFIGVKDGRAVTVRGNPNHPVNLGKALSQGTFRALHAGSSKPGKVSIAAKERQTGAR